MCCGLKRLDIINQEIGGKIKVREENAGKTVAEPMLREEMRIIGHLLEK